MAATAQNVAIEYYLYERYVGMYVGLAGWLYLACLHTKAPKATTPWGLMCISSTCMKGITYNGVSWGMYVSRYVTGLATWLARCKLEQGYAGLRLRTFGIG